MFLDLQINGFSGAGLSATSDEIAVFESRNANLTADMEKYLVDGEKNLNAAAIEDHLFPKLHVDIFISHAHADQAKAINLAIAFQRLGLTAFVDSCVWGHADDLLLKVDKKFSANKKAENSYFYELRNRTTSNVHMILNSALHEMIDRSELLIFLDTDHSVKVRDLMEDDQYLSSPWIFSELMFAKRARRTPRQAIRMSLEHQFEAYAGTEKRKFEFQYELPQLTSSVSYPEFLMWIKSGNTSSTNRLNALKHLDVLYKQVGVSAELLKDPRFFG
ncbi:hypothetical protein PflCFBP13510_07505 [Pseudomonas fluorescens]|uniref:toll/interleukin-1 receptor domain-containing protein n=1 Tax=Pseudomonas sp. MH9.3 TaxID=3048630 RepID=UPI0010BF8CAF|nr:toll/interleukin-1 receptor domain-containing protein [Pseudomonas sp. MH9.3]MEB0106829.1 toll/interleukin-1 receptor domain-containing protein [Pseudomonas sp. MH9.3]TKK12541.1 hypothetical protein PflCFBP13510_07505 [Pseudomonas fluorescens]WPX77652.1 toll/interleukin-1 receptor domain-containing protein [Pseudomonas sp. MH9.3]